MSLNDIKDQLQDIKHKFQSLSVDDKSEAVILVQKLQDMLLKKDGNNTESPVPSVSVRNFKANASLAKHSHTQDNTQAFCKLCSKSLISWPLFFKHCSKHACNICPVCENKFSRKIDLCLHLSSSHKIGVSGESYSCMFCHKTFHKESNYRAHLQKHTSMCNTKKNQDKHSNISKCSAESSKRPKRKRFPQKHSEQCKEKPPVIRSDICNASKRYTCDICQETFSKSPSFLAHKHIHENENGELLQPGCAGAFELQLKTQEFGEKDLSGCNEAKGTVRCSLCGAQFKYKQGLVRHIEQKHSDCPSYKCPYCDFLCRCKTNLKRHVELHKNDRRFVCELCGSSFNALATLKGHHSYVHSDERKFVCNICSRGFKGRSGLLRHLRIHRDDRPYSCYHCTVSYKRMSHLKRHMLSAHKQKLKSNRVRKLTSNETKSTESGRKTTTNYMLPNKTAGIEKSISSDLDILGEQGLAVSQSGFVENIILETEVVSEMSDTLTSGTFCDPCPKTALLSTMEIPFTTLEELSLNSIPFNVIPLEETVLMVKYNQTEVNDDDEMNLAECIINKEDQQTAISPPNKISTSTNNIQIESQLADCITNVNASDIDFNMFDEQNSNTKSYDKNKLQMMDSQLYAQPSIPQLWTRELDIENSTVLASGNNLKEDIQKESSVNITDNSCLTNPHVKLAEMSYNSLSVDSFTPALFTTNAASFVPDGSDFHSHSLQPLAENLYPDTIGSFLPS